MDVAKKLTGSRCTVCATHYFPPRGHCVRCESGPELTEPVELSGRGELYSFTNLHIGPIAPCGVGYVDLEEGTRVLARFTFSEDPAALVAAGPEVTVGFGADGSDLEGVVVGSFGR